MTNLWPSVALADLVPPDDKINYGVVQPGPDVPQGVRLVRVGDIFDGSVSTASLKQISTDIEARYSRSRLRGDEVLLACVGSIGAVALATPELAGANIARAVARIRCGPSLDRRYLATYLRTAPAQRYFAKQTRTVAQPTLNIRQIEAIQIPLPPLPEQKRIAAILNKADAIRRKRQQAIELTENLLRAAFLEMFGDPVTNPKGWEVQRLGAAIAEAQYGTAAKANSARIGLPILRMNNITYAGGWDLTNLKWCDIAAKDVDKYTTRRGDLLFNRTNSPELVGKTAVWDSDDVYAIAGYLVRVRFNGLAEPHYVSALLNSSYGKRLIFAKAKPSNNMSNFSASELRRLEVPLPPRPEQERFAELALSAQRARPARAEAAKQAEELCIALTQRAFAGGL